MQAVQKTTIDEYSYTKFNWQKKMGRRRKLDGSDCQGTSTKGTFRHNRMSQEIDHTSQRSSCSYSGNPI